jgi:hypothetical protein
MARDYYKGMPYGEFLQMMAERRADLGMEHPDDPLAMSVKPCEHPFDLVDKTFHGKRRSGGVRITVEYHCTECNLDLGEDAHSFKLEG